MTQTSKNSQDLPTWARCPVCGAAPEVQEFQAMGRSFKAWVLPCSCIHENETQKRDRLALFDAAGIDPEGVNRINAAPILSKIYQTQSASRTQGAFLHGVTGTGKTSMLDAIGRRVIEGNEYEAGGRINCRKRVRMVGAVELFESLRGYADAKARERLADLKNCDWLLLDDLGQERASEWVLERLFELIDARYHSHNITCISSNLTLPELGRKWAAVDDLKARVMVRRVGFITFDCPMDTRQTAHNQI